MNLDEMRLDLAKRSKRGLHIIIASVFIWSLVLIIWLLPIKTVEGQNLLTFCALTPLLPFSYMISKII
jgi:hypothetical protein